MSDEQRPGDIVFEVSGEWWYIAGYLQNRLKQEFDGTDKPVTTLPGPASCKIETMIGVAIISGQGETTAILFRPAGGNEPRNTWKHIERQTKLFADAAQSVRREGKLSANGAIEYYYRSRARGSKITLREIAEQAGLKYGVLRKRKMEYDARGGWGSKRNKTITENID